ncbi:MAG: HAMP domain-containing protein, partial [Desulfobacterales bacterium]|nr:HAMP domain-containing protein [Desulfobacterales bacterium]
MKNNRFKKSIQRLSQDERKRRKREAIIIICSLFFIAFLTLIENRVIHFGGNFPISNTILMFILININLLLLILIIFLVFRNLVKLLYDRKRKVMGAKLRTRLVVAFVALSLLPAGILFFFSINFITTSIEFWFNVPVEQALENSIKVGRNIYQHMEESNAFFLERISYQLKNKNLLAPENKTDLSRYIKVVQREFNLHAVEVYASNAARITYALSPDLENSPFMAVSADNLQKKTNSNRVQTLLTTIAAGELVRTIATVPFGQSPQKAEAFIVLNILIPLDLSEQMASISRGIEEYQRILLLKKPIQITYHITLSIVALLVVFCAIWFGFYMAKTISIPIKELAEGTRRVAEGDLSFSIGRVADDEMGSLVTSFNKMTRDLRSNREQLELSARMLREQNIEIEARRQYMEIVLINVSAGVITLDAGGFITTMNKSAERLIHLPSIDIINKSYKKVLNDRY